MQAKTTKDKATRTAEQNAQARLVLIQLLWLFVLLIIAAMVWLYNNQKKLSLQVEERLAIIKTFDGRMNDMDDRIFAMTAAPQQIQSSHTANTDMQLTNIQLDVVDRLYRQGDYQDTFDMLKMLQQQLGSDELSLAAPLKSSLALAIQEDLASLAVLQKTTDPWHAHMVRLQEIQSYLRQVEKDLPKNDMPSRKELVLRDGMIAVSLAMGATAMKDRSMMIAYMNDGVYQLKRFEELGATNTANKTNDAQSNSPQKTIESIAQAIFAINDLLANPPTLPPLKSVALFDTPKNSSKLIPE